jgi:hypothetical protein
LKRNEQFLKLRARQRKKKSMRAQLTNLNLNCNERSFEIECVQRMNVRNQRAQRMNVCNQGALRGELKLQRTVEVLKLSVRRNGQTGGVSFEILCGRLRCATCYQL